MIEMDSSNAFRDPKGRFLTANNGGPGRPKGSRNKLGEEFLDDLIEEWRANGKKALALCAAREPTQFCKLVSNILPKEVLSMALNVNATLDMSEIEQTHGFLAAYRYARDRIGAVPLIDEEPLEAKEGASVWGASRGADD
jgi:hypothetical protein